MDGCKQTFSSEHGRNIHHAKTHRERESDQTQCPTCGKHFKTEPGMKTHHVQAHGEYLRADPGDIACPHDKCEDLFDSEMGVKVHHIKAHDESIAQVEEECANCGKTTNKIQSEAKRVGTIFCDNECKFEYNTGETSPYYDRIEVECANCDAPLERTPSKMRMNDEHFCDKQCAAAHRDTKIKLTCDHWAVFR